jgi:hypothetical protein
VPTCPSPSHPTPPVRSHDICIYSDYRGLKKRITAIRREQEGAATAAASSSGEDPLLPRAAGVDEPSDSAASPPRGADDRDADEESDGYEQDLGDAAAELDAKDAGEDRPQRAVGSLVAKERQQERNETHDTANTMQPSPTAKASLGRRMRSGTLDSVAENPRVPEDLGPHPSPGSPQSDQQHSAPERPSHNRSNTLLSLASRFRRSSINIVPQISPFLRSMSTPVAHGASRASLTNNNTSTPGGIPAPPFNGVNGNMQPAGHVAPLREVLPRLTTTQKKFFDKLDAELEKIENFYLDREHEAKARCVFLAQLYDTLITYSTHISVGRSR